MSDGRRTAGSGTAARTAVDGGAEGDPPGYGAAAASASPPAGVPGARAQISEGLRRHGVDRATFTALARARGGAPAVRLLRAGQLSKRALLLVALRRAVPAPEREAFEGAYTEVCALQRADRSAWERLLLRPEFDAWAAGCLQLLAAGREAPLGGLGHFLHGPRPAATPVPLECDGLRWTPLVTDRGPYRDLYGHPPAGPLDPAELDRWRLLLAGAWEVLVRRHPWHAEAVGACVSTLVPLRPAPDGSAVSAAARRAYGAVAASRPAEPVLLALALVHEFLHVQLGALLDLVPLHRPNGEAKYHAPWRPDLRPAGALLQGAYAHLGVTDFWRGELAAGAPGRARAEREHRRWRGHTGAAATTLLASGELTRAGEEFVREFGRAAEYGPDCSGGGAATGAERVDFTAEGAAAGPCSST
ncbi:HEXXH motif-containing putative peptide modification protein [Kitasatospora indigofera]|uniref:aKG-HExxH-type peptide beta-hydroxylase n=1 Tax=Kitasatospora indigofera TaxID=67307 RepID=UPI00364E7847